MKSSTPRRTGIGLCDPMRPICPTRTAGAEHVCLRAMYTGQPRGPDVRGPILSSEADACQPRKNGCSKDDDTRGRSKVGRFGNLRPGALEDARMQPCISGVAARGYGQTPVPEPVFSETPPAGSWMSDLCCTPPDGATPARDTLRGAWCSESTEYTWVCGREQGICRAQGGWRVPDEMKMASTPFCHPLVAEPVAVVGIGADDRVVGWQGNAARRWLE